MRLSPVCTAIDSTCLPRGSGGHCCGIAERRLRLPASGRPQDQELFEKKKGLRMKNVYEVLRQKELEVLRLEEEVEALRIAAPLLSEDGEAEKDNEATLRPAVNDVPQKSRPVWEDRAKKQWP